MKKTFYTLIFSAVMLLSIQTNSVYGQCTDFVNGPFPDFTNMFGDAPCDDGSGCQFNEITAFQVFASESYSMLNIVEGGQYAFSMCNGPDAFTWIPDFAIVAPSGAIDAFGAGDGDACTISWTASESGTYTVIINEEGFCGGGTNIMTSNGFPAITCLSGTPCPLPPMVPGCSAGVLTTTGEVDVCDAIQTFTLQVEGDTIPDGGDLAITWIPQSGASGATNGIFTIGIPANPITLNSDLNGTFSNANLAPFDGRWAFLVVARDSLGTICSQTTDTLFVNFGPDGATCDPDANICVAGTIASATQASICEIGGTFDIAFENDTIPAGGFYGWLATNELGGTGGDPSGSLGFASDGLNMATFDSGLAGTIDNAGLEPLVGAWVFRGIVINGGAICDVSTDSMIVFFGTESPVITGFDFNGAGELTVNPVGGVAPYTYLWNDPAAQTTQTAVGLESGTFTVVVSDANQCITTDSESIINTSTNVITTLSNYTISPNPSEGNFTVDLNFEQNSLIDIDILDITGRVIRKASQQGSSALFNFDMLDAPAGMYFINIKVGQESMTQKIVVSK